MKNNIETKSRFVGEIVLILMLQIVMLLFRLVEPIHWPSLISGPYKDMLNEFAYFGIEFVLIIVIIAHLIFFIPFKELGMDEFKKNKGLLIGNLCYVALGVGVAYVMSQFSKNIEVNLITVTMQIITNFVAIAFLKEVIFRGFLFRAILNLVNQNGIVASLITAIFFALNYIPTILIQLNEVSGTAVMQALMIPFIMGLYLSLVYYYTKNLWLCTIIHGVLISLGGLEQDFALVAVESVYVIGLVVYLVKQILKFYREKNQIVEDKEVSVEAEESLEDMEVNQVEPQSMLEDEPKMETSEVKEVEAETTAEVGYIILGQSKIIESASEKIEEQSSQTMIQELDQLQEALREEMNETVAITQEEIPDLQSVLSDEEE